MASMGSRVLNRLEGRLFVEDGHLYYVLHVDLEAEIARVSVRKDGQQNVVEMPLHAIGAKVGACNQLSLDGLETKKTADRVMEQDDGWYFKAREGLRGPHENEDEAKAALKNYIIAVQGADVEYDGRLARVD